MARIGLVAAAVLVLLLALANAFVDEPLRQLLERRVNESLTGYTVTIGDLDLQPIGLTLELEDVSVVQKAKPDPPVALLPRWATSVHWGALLSGALVADAVFDGPRLHLTLAQAEQEAVDETLAVDRGWQDAVAAVYPLEINAFTVRDARITYADVESLPPVELTDVAFETTNVRNVVSAAGSFPSPLRLDARLVDGGTLAVRGHADYLAKPRPTFRADVALRDVAMERLVPIARHAGVDMKGGTFSGDAHVETTPERTRVRASDVEIADVTLDYVQRTAADERRLESVARAATETAAAPTVEVDVEELRIRHSTLGFVDRTGDPDYRLFVTDADADVLAFSNTASKRRGTAAVRGRFMGAGSAALDARFLSGAKTADFELAVRLEQVDLTTMNDLLRARGGLDVAAGRFSFYSELTVRDGRIDGYVKPLFSDLDVYEETQDQDDGLPQRLREAVVGAVAGLLQNRPRDEVATEADLSGPIENPNASTFEILIGLLRNAFFVAILPGLEGSLEDRDDG